LIIDDKKIANYRRLRALFRECTQAWERASDAGEPEYRVKALYTAALNADDARYQARASVINDLYEELDKP